MREFFKPLPPTLAAVFLRMTRRCGIGIGKQIGVLLIAHGNAQILGFQYRTEKKPESFRMKAIKSTWVEEAKWDVVNNSPIAATLCPIVSERMHYIGIPKPVVASQNLLASGIFLRLPNRQQVNFSFEAEENKKIWSGCRDLNSGPLAPQASALARLRHSPILSGGHSGHS
jgi:hypothetical protein